jgi:hypothetical protein
VINGKNAQHDRLNEPAVGSVMIKHSQTESNMEPPSKKARLLEFFEGQSGPAGFTWDPVHYSCLYDAIFTKLGDIWLQNLVRWSYNFNAINQYIYNCYLQILDK